MMNTIESNKYTCTRRFRIDAMHRVLEQGSKCEAVHGHSWTIDVTVSAPKLNHIGMVLDFSKIKEVLGAWLDEHWDHNSILNKKDPLITKLSEEQKNAIFLKKKPYLLDCNPTAEHLAEYFCRIAKVLLTPYKISVTHVRVYETPNCWADSSLD